MKVEKVNHDLVITAEGRKERAVMKLLFKYNNTIAKALAEKGFDKAKIRELTKATGISKKSNIKDSTLTELFGAETTEDTDDDYIDDEDNEE